MNLHNDQSAKKCHYYNNEKICPFKEIGCQFLGEASEMCFLQSRCRMHPYKHDKNSENDSGNRNKPQEDNNKQNAVILKAFEDDSRDFLGYKKNVGFTMLLKNVKNVNLEQTAQVF